MNIFQKIAGTVFPPYRYKIIRQEENLLFNSIIHALPESYKDLKTGSESTRFSGLQDWIEYPGFKTSIISCSEETLLKHRKRGENYKISGLSIYSKVNNRPEDIEILIKDNLVAGIKINNSDFKLSDFDINKIINQNVSKTSFEFPPDETEIFYTNLDPEIKDKLRPDDIFDIDFNRRTYYVFCDLEDGNYLAVDKNQKVYSLVHDAKPMAKSMKCSFGEILNEISYNKFDKEKHLEERYKNSR